MQSAARTHVGRRSGNEDAHLVDEEHGLFVVADGMGGYEGGEWASRIVVDALAEFFRANAVDPDATWPVALDRNLSFAENLLAAAIRLAHRGVCAGKHGILAQMGSTVAALAIREGQAIIGHVGDSRVYRYRDGDLEQLTRDHSLWEELRASGREVADYRDFPYKNVITRAVGMKEMAPSLSKHSLQPSDVFLICSDGLLETLDDGAIAAVLGAEDDSSEACRLLVEGAYDGGSKDNITVVVVRISAASE
ncbi:MAG: serine/threonine-protein phosphatase [Deltaproteobacteria bacterium]|nr:serine/threonine-protein phosphatase [Deltaproteobacteria bacterium]